MGNLNSEHRVYLIFNLKLKSDISVDKAEQWIKERSAKYVFELKEEKGVSFEWFLSDDNTEATIIESYLDSDGAKQRLENHAASPIATDCNVMTTGKVKLIAASSLVPTIPTKMVSIRLATLYEIMDNIRNPLRRNMCLGMGPTVRSRSLGRPSVAS